MSTTPIGVGDISWGLAPLPPTGSTDVIEAALLLLPTIEDPDVVDLIEALMLAVVTERELGAGRRLAQGETMTRLERETLERRRLELRVRELVAARQEALTHG